ncbi:hypothetical protein BDP27DRAFT_1424006 [Rhodocollybia butyracea]|uniref:F-box domain-containing protein n=1 Tax=Rhodocollybia butyracea TaxID=206335 RepID=A0A9P5PIC5_9AGAR|nr:hypothetical protein BDP27DRAFT_1424006 [Rhodocollybia butyracea]
MHLLYRPNELLVIILGLLEDDKQAPAALSCLSKRIRHLAYLLLYRTITASALSTLSTDDTISRELHPAAYVHNLVIDNLDFPQIYRDNYLTEHMYHANQKVGHISGVHNHSLTKLSFQSVTLPLSNVLVPRVPLILLNLENLVLRAPFPQEKIRLCTSIFVNAAMLKFANAPSP